MKETQDWYEQRIHELQVAVHNIDQERRRMAELNMNTYQRGYDEGVQAGMIAAGQKAALLQGELTAVHNQLMLCNKERVSLRALADRREADWLEVHRILGDREVELHAANKVCEAAEQFIADYAHEALPDIEPLCQARVAWRLAKGARK